MNIFSVKVETYNLYGDGDGVAAVVMSPSGEIIDYFQGRVSMGGGYDQWVRDRVVPHCRGIHEYPSPRELRDAFWAFWTKHRVSSVCIAHVGTPVEAGFFKTCVMDDPDTRLWQGPCPLHDVATLMLSRGFGPETADGYIKDHKLTVPSIECTDLLTRNELRRALAAATVWQHLMSTTNK